eukprot:10408802-Alexandrium_andersonii.AAC.1
MAAAAPSGWPTRSVVPARRTASKELRVDLLPSLPEPLDDGLLRALARVSASSREEPLARQRGEAEAAAPEAQQQCNCLQRIASGSPAAPCQPPQAACALQPAAGLVEGGADKPTRPASPSLRRKAMCLAIQRPRNDAP